MKVLVTGAGGFLGSRVVAQFLDRGHTVRAMVRSVGFHPPDAWRGRAEIVAADLRGASAALEACFDGVDVLVHLAATMRGSPEAQFVGSVACTEKLLNAMRCAGGTRHIVLAGSCSVYDWTAARGPLSEESPLESRPYERDGYTIAKMWQERVSGRLADENGWTLAVLRPGLIYGHGAAPAAGAGVSVGKIFVVVAPFSRLRLTHVENCAAAFIAAAERRIGGNFNVIDDDEISAWRYAGRLDERAVRVPFPYGVGLALAYLAKATSRVLFPPNGGKLPGILIPRRYRARFRPFRYDTRKAKKVLGWDCKSFFQAGCDVV